MSHRILASVTAAVAAGAAALLTAGPAVAAAPATVPPTTCSGVVRIDGFAFDPPEIAPGGSSTATLAATNCTASSQTVSETWYGTWLSSSGTTGIPSGCPAIDPLPRTVAFAPHQSLGTSSAWYVFPGCTANGLRLTVRITQGPTLLGQAVADLKIDQPV